MAETTFDNEFDLTTRDLNDIVIKETFNKDKCCIWDINDSNKVYNSFILSKNTKSKIICEIAFYRSSKTNKYLPRPTFKKLLINGETPNSKSENKITISLNDSEEAILFWKLIGFLSSYKEIVDLDEFEKSYQVIPKDSYIIEFKNKIEKDKINDLIELIGLAELTNNDIKSLTFESRKKNIKAFYYLLKNIKNS